MFEQRVNSDVLTVSTVNSQDQVTQKPLRDSVKQALKNYFAQLNGQDVNDLYELVLAEVEQPLLDMVMQYTRGNQTRAALMIGRAAQGRPWIFREIQHYLDTGELLAPLPLAEVKRLLCSHVRELHDHYGQAKGYRIARKHVSWYLQEHAPNDQFRRTFNAIEDASDQLEALEAYFENLA